MLMPCWLLAADDAIKCANTQERGRGRGQGAGGGSGQGAGSLWGSSEAAGNKRVFVTLHLKKHYVKISLRPQSASQKAAREIGKARKIREKRERDDVQLDFR